MSRLRCFPTFPEAPGTLYLATIQLHVNSAPILKDCMDEALEKWQRLFTVKVIHYSLEATGCAMVIHVPSKLLSPDEAKARNNAFDLHLLEAWQARMDVARKNAQELNQKFRKSTQPRGHNFSSEQLNSLSEFMRLFKPELRNLHLYKPRPQDLLPGFSKVPIYRKRFTAMVVQHDYFPPFFPEDQMRSISEGVFRLGYEGNVESSRSKDLYISQHGIGSQDFLAEVEERCCLLLKARGREPELWQRFGHKYISKITQEAVDRLLGDLTLREEYDDHPKMWSLLAQLDGWTDKLLDADNISISVPMPAIRQVGLVAMCLPLSLTLLLTDGMLRWYYKKTKDVEFPHYNYYRRLLPWEVKHGSRH